MAPPAFDLDSALAEVQAAEDSWNTRDPWHVWLGCSPDSVWRNRDTFVTGRDEIVDLPLRQPWAAMSSNTAYIVRVGTPVPPLPV
ncbi:DUF1348 family protein [Mycolicibacterium sarraceniae]|uniref:Uncharacterized protein n=1 Tax=Mycolicibacterium sarraceniae TaxID=1534348 RepID=A0A7I7STV0_9MYCO|nr:DUF1348 family protein [Mycolicibacterium sarraceniae]BBY60434.1 hypothetical protein MSAR_35700 [Mycolicibacterium sarraceniae]